MDWYVPSRSQLLVRRPRATDSSCASAGIVFLLWITVFLRSIPAFIDGSMFKAPYVPDEPAPSKKGVFDPEKMEGFGSHATSAATVIAI